MPTSAGLFDEKRFPNALKVGRYLEPFPAVVLTFAQWLSRLSTVLKSKKKELGTIVALSGEVAGNDITSSSHEPDAVVSFDAQEAQRLKVQLGDAVQVAPEDTGRASIPYTSPGHADALQQGETTRRSESWWV